MPIAKPAKQTSQDVAICSSAAFSVFIQKETSASHLYIEMSTLDFASRP